MPPVIDTVSTHSHEKSASENLWAVKHWPAWLGLGLLRALAMLPYRWQLKIGRTIGLLLWRNGGRRRHIAATNLRLCFPELSPEQRETLLREHFISLGISFLEMTLAWRASDRRLKGLFKIEGLEHIDAALAQGRGVLMLSAHFTTLEIGCRLLAVARGVKHNALYRKHKNAVFEHAQSNGRAHNFANPIPRDDMRQMIKRLKNKEIIWYAPDQNYGHKHSVFAPFFDVPAASNTSTSRLSRISGAAVVPFFQHRNADGSGYTLVVLPALENFPSDDLAADTTRINAIIEAEVRVTPEQYLWVHRRFKDRPEGAADIYATPSVNANPT